MNWVPYARKKTPRAVIKEEKKEKSFFIPSDREEDIRDYDLEELKSYEWDLEHWLDLIDQGREKEEFRTEAKKKLKKVRARIKVLTKKYA